MTRRRLAAIPCLRFAAAFLALALLLTACGSRSGSSPRAQQPATNLAPAAAATPQVPTQVFVALGASDAFGIGTDNPKTQAWPVVLAHLLGSDAHLVNLGIPGADVPQAARDELPVALAARPSIITVWLAVNDFDSGVTLHTYELQLRDLLAALVAGTSAHIYVGDMPDLTLIPYFAGRDHQTLVAQIKSWNAGIAAVCAEVGVTLVDIYGGWRELAEHPEYISGDGFHPSAAGAKRLAEIFAAAIQASARPQPGGRT
jgi:acyl-CoA thioesterase I